MYNALKDDEDGSSIGYKSKRKLVRRLPQVGKSNKSIDESRNALTAGKRVSKNGKVYWETRKNRSDNKNSI
jgi:hypothetical protein